MTVIDLTHTIREDMPVYPGTEPPRLTTACTVSQCGYRETLLHMYSHTGTHMDAPAHMMDGAPTLDSFGPDRFVGRGYVLDCRGLSQIPLDLLLQHEAALRDTDFLLFCTGWDQYWGADAYYEGFPCLTEEAARFVAGPAPEGGGRGFHLSGPLRHGGLPQPPDPVFRGAGEYREPQGAGAAHRPGIHVPDHAPEI